MVLATNCSRNHLPSVTHHHRHKGSAVGAPDTLHASRAIEFADSSADFLVRLIVGSIQYNKLILAVFESPAKKMQQQPVYYEKIVYALGLKETRLCRCRL